MERFWSKVEKQEGDGCWIWKAHTMKRNGYGQFSVNGRPPAGRVVCAHRFSWELTNGSIPAGLSVLHRCDTPQCVRPSHLFLGTQRENLIDAENKGRMPGRIDDATIAEMRRLRDGGMTYQKIATALGRRFGENVSAALRRREGRP